MKQALLNGFIQGGTFALLGVAFSLIYSITRRVLFIALGGIYALAPYFYMSARAWNWPVFVGVISTIAFAALLSVACEEYVHWPLEGKRASSEVNFIASLGCFLVLGQITVLLWGDGAQSLGFHRATFYQGLVLHISSGQILSIATGVLFLPCLAFLFWKTELGNRLSALASNPQLLSTTGIDVQWLRRLAFALAGALATLASLVNAVDIGFDPQTGMQAVVVGIVASTLGGRCAFVAAALAGFLLGMLRSMVEYTVSPALVESSTFAVLALVLFFAPSGLGGCFTGRCRPEAK